MFVNAAGLRFSPVSSTNKNDCHDITEILLKVALNAINPNSVTVKIHKSKSMFQFYIQYLISKHR
jgi:hypothetical protein